MPQRRGHNKPGATQPYKAVQLQLSPDNLREETLNGRQFLVADTIAVKQMVLNGQLLPAEEIVASVEDWNGMPVTDGHPDIRTNGFVGFDEEDAERRAIGEFLNAKVVDQTKLAGEMWLFVPGRNERAREIVKALEDGQELEVSTGYLAASDDEAGLFDSKAFLGIQRDLAPHHLAVLLDEKGACSNDDGCGVPRPNALTKARRPNFSGTETRSWSQVNKSLDAFLDGYYRSVNQSRPDEVTSIDSAPKAAKQWIASKSLLGDPNASELGDLVFFPVVNPATNKLNRGALLAVLSGRGSQARIARTALDSARSVADRMLNQFRNVASDDANAEPDGTGHRVSYRQLLGQLLADLFGSKAMNKKEELIAQIANARNFNDDQKASLDGLEEPTLEALAAESKGNAADEAKQKRCELTAKIKANQANKLSDQQLVALDDETLANLAETVSASTNAGTPPADQKVGLEQLAPELQAVVRQSLDSEASKRNGLVERLKANPRCNIDEETLKAMALTTLEELDRMAAPANYMGANGSFTELATNEDDDEFERRLKANSERLALEQKAKAAAA